MLKLTLSTLFVTLTTVVGASAQSSLTTTFANNNNGAAGWSTFFDLTVQAPVGITALDVNVNSAGSVGSVDVFVTAPGVSHVGNEASPVWTLVGSSQQVAGSAAGTPTNCPMMSPIVLSPGTFGVAIHYIGFRPLYTNGTGTNQHFSTPELTLVAGSSSSVAPGAGSTLFTPRVWNGTIHYFITTGSGFGTALPVGAGCGGSSPETFFETFSATNPFDLTSGFAILPSGNEQVVITGFSPLVAPSGPAFAIRDDQTLQVALPWPLPVRGGVTSDVWLCSNGWVALESTTSTDLSESLAELLSGPRRVCAMWDDLNPERGGSVHAERDPADPNAFHITFTAVPEDVVGAGPDTFQYTFDSSGTIEVKYGVTSVGDCLVGFSHGNGAATVMPSDLSDPTLTLQLGTGRRALELRGGARPVLGTTATVITDAIPTNATGAVLLVGYTGFNPGRNLTGLGLPGCTLFTSGQFPVSFSASTSPSTVSFPIGNDLRLRGANLHLQSAVLVPGINPLNLILSNGLVWTIGQN